MVVSHHVGNRRAVSGLTCSNPLKSLFVCLTLGLQQGGPHSCLLTPKFLNSYCSEISDNPLHKFLSVHCQSGVPVLFAVHFQRQELDNQGPGCAPSGLYDARATVLRNTVNLCFILCGWGTVGCRMAGTLGYANWRNRELHQWTFEKSLVNTLIKNQLALLPDSKPVGKYTNIANI